jgi:biopolymer transport protein ExbB/TolQ
MHIFYSLSDFMTLIILLCAVIEILMFYYLILNNKKLSGQLQDSLINMLKGIKEIPDKDRNRNIHDEIEVLLDTIEVVKSSSSTKEKKKLKKNIKKEDQKKIDKKIHHFDIFTNLTSSGVQIFPLLGILGTIIALGKSISGTGQTGNMDIVMKAFILAIDTTILGIFFGIVFMVADAFSQAKTNKLKKEINQYRDITRFSRIKTKESD